MLSSKTLMRFTAIVIEQMLDPIAGSTHLCSCNFFSRMQTATR
jgi:hypothetical protein